MTDGRHRRHAPERDRHHPSLNRSVRLPAADGPAIVRWMELYAEETANGPGGDAKTKANGVMIAAWRDFIARNGGMARYAETDPGRDAAELSTEVLAPPWGGDTEVLTAVLPPGAAERLYGAGRSDR